MVRVGKVIDKGIDAERVARRALEGGRAVERSEDFSDLGRNADRVGHLGKSEIMPYRELQKISLPKGMERHKLIEWREAKYLGFKSRGDVPAVALWHGDHNMITQMLKHELPYGSKYWEPSVQAQYRGIYAKVYGEGSEWFNAISRYFP